VLFDKHFLSLRGWADRAWDLIPVRLGWVDWRPNKFFFLKKNRLGWGSNLHNLVTGPTQWLSCVVNCRTWIIIHILGCHCWEVRCKNDGDFGGRIDGWRDHWRDNWCSCYCYEEEALLLLLLFVDEMEERSWWRRCTIVGVGG